MPATRLQRLARVTLAGILGVVGVAGGSTHVLINDASEPATAADAVQTVVYFHVHGPDYHGHFHRHVRHVQRGHLASAGYRAAHKSKGGPAFDTDWTNHKPHGCPALCLTAKLKLFHGDGSTPAILKDSLVTGSRQPGVLIVPEVVLDFHARGPPSASLA
jgi:hypothetical protein